MSCQKYDKIDTLFDRGEDFRVDESKVRRPEFLIPRNWAVTEKIDGTNCRISLEPEMRQYPEHHHPPFPASVRDMAEPERAWVGSMIEADGNVCFSEKSRSPGRGQWALSVANTDLEIMSALVRATGVGSITFSEAKLEKHKNRWDWKVYRFNDMKGIADQCGQYSQKLQRLQHAKSSVEPIEPIKWIVRFYGRTENSQMPTFLLDYLQRAFTLEKMQSLWRSNANCEKCVGLPFHRLSGILCECFTPYPIVLYGEGYGARIQKGGGDYRRDEDVSFRLFDVLIGGTWLNRENVENVAVQLSIKPVPLIAAGAWTIEEIVAGVKEGLDSMVASEEGTPKTQAEGVVAFTDPPLFNSAGKRLMFKLKTSDFRHE